MKDFYEARAKEFAEIDRGFTFAGVEFKLKPVMPADVQGDLHMLGHMDDFTDNLYDHMVGIVRRTLRPEYRATWDQVLAQEREVPITLQMLSELVGAISEEDQALVAEETGRPTQPPSPSGVTASSASTRSTGNSDSKERAGSATSRSVPA